MAFTGQFLIPIQVLTLDMTYRHGVVSYWMDQVCMLSNEIRNSLNLKHLELIGYVHRGDTLSFCILLLKALPSISLLTLEIILRTDRKFIMERRLGLKELRLVGFSGTACEVEFVMCLLENAVELEKTIVDPMLPKCQLNHGLYFFQNLGS